MNIAAFLTPVLLLGIGFTFSFIAFELGDRHSVLKVFFLLQSLLQGVFALWISSTYILNSSGWTGLGSVLSKAGLGMFFIFFVVLLYFGIVLYMNDAFKTVTGSEFTEEGILGGEDDDR